MPEPAGDTQIPVFAISSFERGFSLSITDSDGNPVSLTEYEGNEPDGYDLFGILPTDTGTIIFADGGAKASATARVTFVYDNGGYSVEDEISTATTVAIPEHVAAVFIDENI